MKTAELCPTHSDGDVDTAIGETELCQSKSWEHSIPECENAWLSAELVAQNFALVQVWYSRSLAASSFVIVDSGFVET